MASQAKNAKPVHEIGKYVVVWKKQPDGTYKIFRDIGNDDSPMK